MKLSTFYCVPPLLGLLSLWTLPLAIAAPLPEVLAQAPAQPAPSLDDELLKDLEADLDEDVTKKPDTKQPARPDSDAPAQKPSDQDSMDDDLLNDDALDQELLRQLQPETADDDSDLSKISRAMRQAKDLVSQAKSGQSTQEIQDKIVVDLNKLLDEARKRQRQSKSSSSSSQQSASRQPAGQQQARPGKSGSGGDQPAQESSDKLRDRTAASPDPEQMKDLLRDLWGHLPEHERQMVINSTIERFLPKYELMIEAYFKRLAAEAAEK